MSTFTPELINYFNHDIISQDNYKDFIKIYHSLQVDKNNSKILAINIAKLDFYNKDKKFREFYNKFVDNKFNNKGELRKAIKLYCQNKEECELKYGFVKL